MADAVSIKRRRKVPLRIGDIWVYLGPATEHRIIALEPRPTTQKPDSQAVTLDDGRTLAEATLRGSYQRKQEYIAYMPVLARKWQRATDEFFGRRPRKARVIKFPKAARG